MTPSFHPRLVNDPFSDPGLFIPFLFKKRAILFDLGDLSALSARDILKISHIFITHTHMDHFIGFDFLLRHLLGRDKEIHLYGPSNFIQNVEAKLNAYTWNLIENYENTLSLIVTEVHEKHIFVQKYNSRDRFKALKPPEKLPFEGMLLSEQSFSVNAVLLD
ncbi:MAG: MBL fold metallo-hydrolase, partial [Thermodesulfobacteriota bacterium]|nr:MBL fold metallo-hydrolase [Thermodesulfobacteriota bacterium]